MLTKADFQRAIELTIGEYPTLAPLFQAKDPRIIQQLDAMATMLAMFSAQVETAQTEQYDKTRDGTILADAAMRGIVRKGKAARARIKAENGGKVAINIVSGRNIVDSNGLYWRVETAATVEPGQSATFEASQQNFRTIKHTVTDSMPFYPIEIPTADDGSYLCTIAVNDSQGAYEYRDRYTNTFTDEKVFHVEADDRQRVFVRFGFKSVVGVQPEDGRIITLTVSYTAGDVKPEYQSPFSFEYTENPNENNVTLSMDALIKAGENPISMTVLHDVAKYPGIYRRDAVFLGEFGFLVRSNFPTLQFLSVWNETMEEAVRGPNVSNVNCLFVACLSQEGGEKTLEQALLMSAVAPQEIQAAQLTETQKAIIKVIHQADDSYRVRFFTPVISKINVTINARVSSTYRTDDVEKKIREAILTQYGKTSAAAKRGLQRPLYRDIYDLIKRSIPALTDGEADLQVSIAESEDRTIKPEQWRFVDESSLTVKVETANIVMHSWGG